MSDNVRRRRPESGKPTSGSAADANDNSSKARQGQYHISHSYLPLFLKL